MHTGANAGKFEKFILENLKPGEPGYGSARSSRTRPWRTPRRVGKSRHRSVQVKKRRDDED